MLMEARVSNPSTLPAVTKEMVEVAWAAIVGSDIAATCFHANIVRGDLRAAIEAALASLPLPVPGEGETFQARVQPWMMACFGPEISGDKVERGDRLLEEVLELLQSGGYDPARVLALRDYVWARPAGEPSQEVGGVQVTLAAYCLAHALDMHEAGETELARIWTKVEKIRAKQAAKPVGSALPVALSPTAPELGAVKALEWRANPLMNWVAQSIVGQYFVFKDADDSTWALAIPDVVAAGEFKTAELAKAAAQADYEARILSALVRSATPYGQPQTDEMQPDTYTGGDFNGVVRGKRP